MKYGHDLKLQIATAKTRKAKTWKNQEVSWGEFVKRLSDTHYTHETVLEYQKMTKEEQDQIKDVGGFVGGHLIEGRRKNGYVKSRQIITLDADYATPELWDEIEMLAGYAMLCYSTHKHTPEKPRFRVVIPLARPVGPEEYEAIARKIAEEIGMDYFDDTTYEPTRLMYWPSTSKDGEYFFRVVDLPILEPQEILDLYDDWKDTSYWPESSRASTKRKKTADKQGDPLEKQGLIGAFCRTYSIHEAIDKFLSDIYIPSRSPERYTYAKGSTSSGLVVYDDKFAYSNHGTDPISGQLCNAFDLVRIHKFGELDLEAKEDTPVNRLPSWQKMMELVASDDETKLTIGQEKLELAKSEFSSEELDGEEDAEDAKDAEAEEMDTEWLTKLTTKKDGSYESSVNNILLIIKNDPNLKGIGAHNLFNDKLEVKTKLPWSRSGDFWSDVDDASLRHYLEKIYGIEGRQKIQDALMMALEDKAYHPVKDYLNSLQWDGKKRLERVFIEYLGSSDNHYTRTVTRKTLVAAVARIFKPGCKFDQMLTLVGDQGIGKSLIIQKLGRGWSSDTLTDIRGKEAYEALDGVWLMEMSELVALRKQDREAIKNYISKTEDTYRKAYARNVSVNKRQCIFIGTTNDKEFLNDNTGSRRFWVIDTDASRRTKTVWGDLDDYEIDQIWAEAVELYKAGENIMELDKEAYEHSIKVAEEHSEENPYTGVIMEFLKKPITKDWDNKTVMEKIQWLNATEDFSKDTNNNSDLVIRDKVSAIEVWVECLGKDIASLNKSTSRVINEAISEIPGWTKDKYPRRYGPYGNQRGFSRDIKIEDTTDDFLD